MDVKTVNENKKFDLLKPIKETGKFVKDLFYYGDCLTHQQGERAYTLPPSIQRHMRLCEYLSEDGLFLMDDGRSYASIFEIRGFPTEGRDEKMLEEYMDRIQNLIANIRTYNLKDSPFVVQCYVSDQPNIYGWYERLQEYVSEPAQNTKLRKIYLAMARSHVNFAVQEAGMFIQKGTNKKFRGCERSTYLVVYRKIPVKWGDDAYKEALEVARNIESALDASESYGVRYKRCNDADIYKMLFTWFHKEVEAYQDIVDYLEANAYIKNVEDRPVGYHFLDKAFNGFIESDTKDNCWKIGKTYHKHLSCLGVNRGLNIGHINAERADGGKSSRCFFDTMPEGCVFHVSFICQAKSDFLRDVKSKAKSAMKSTTADAMLTREEAAHWVVEIEHGNLLYPANIGCFVSGMSVDEVNENYDKAKSKLQDASFETLDAKYDIYQLDKFLRFLPGNYEPVYDKRYYASRLLPISQLARLLPIGYSRENGSGNPLLWGMNRGGEMMGVDPFFLDF